MRSRPLPFTALLAATMMATAAGAQTTAPVAPPAPQSCPQTKPQILALPHTIAALKANRELIVAALGSSSTRGWMATDAATTYPAVLQARLAAALPQSHVAVINRGIGGQDAAEEVTRLDADVLNLGPQLVIWQVGANGALRNTDPAVFKKLVGAGIARLRANADVILMDNQRSPEILKAGDHATLETALADLAKTSGASLFSRGTLMDQWKDQGHPYTDYVATDGLHHNDLGYRCVAEALAASIVASLQAAGVDPRGMTTAGALIGMRGG